MKPIALALFCLVQAQDRWEKDIAAFEAKDKESPPPKGGIVFVGSSTIRMWKTEESFPELKVVNRGFGGSQIADSVKYADRIVLPHQPRLVLLFAGGNDINAGKAPEAVFEDYKAFVKKVHDALPRTPILFLSLFPNVARAAQDEKCQALNRLIEAHAKTDERLGYVDVSSKMRSPEGKARPELLLKDGLHMNADGYALVTGIVRPFLEK
jgi:lysophospholipase L1-like esterase